MVDECGSQWWTTERADGSYYVGVHTLIDGERKSTKKAEQQAARTAARICKQLLSRASS
jgi:hypothetical protein